MEFIIKSESGKTRRYDSKSIQNAMIEYFKVTEEKPVYAELRAYDKHGNSSGGMTWTKDQLRGCLPPPKPSKALQSRTNASIHNDRIACGCTF